MAAPISFSLMTASGVQGCNRACQIVVVAEGEINNTAAVRFERLVRENLGTKPRGLTVLLRSPGGYVIAAAKLGNAFRKYRATVVVARAARTDLRTMRITLAGARCVSACVYALMGGQKRVLANGSSIVLHRSYADGGFGQSREYGNDVLRQYIFGYAKSMGINTDVIKFAERLHPSRLYTINPEQARRWKLATPQF